MPQRVDRYVQRVKTQDAQRSSKHISES